MTRVEEVEQTNETKTKDSREKRDFMKNVFRERRERERLFVVYNWKKSGVKSRLYSPCFSLFLSSSSPLVSTIPIYSLDDTFLHPLSSSLQCSLQDTREENKSQNERKNLNSTSRGASVG